MRPTLAHLFTLLPIAASAAPPAGPLPRQGSCPSGYYTSGQYCMPGASARSAIQKTGPCPSGYYASGNYCAANSDSSRQVIPKAGSCPSGWYTSGKYCVSGR